MNKKKIVAISIVVSLVIGMSIASFIAVSFQSPNVKVNDIGDIQSVSDSETNIESSVQIENPNVFPIPVGIVDISYESSVDGIKIVDGNAGTSKISSNSSTEVILNSTIDNKKIPEIWVSYLKSDESAKVNADTDIALDSFVTPELYSTSVQRNISPDTPPVQSALSESASELEGNYTKEIGFSEVNIPGSNLQIDNTIVVGYHVKESNMSIHNVSNNTTQLHLDMVVENPSETTPVPSEPDNLEVSIKSNDIELVRAESVKSRSFQNRSLIQAQDEKKIKYRLNIDNNKIDDAFVSHIKNEEKTEIDIGFSIIFNVDGNEIRVPSESGSQYNCSIQTNIFYENQERSVCEK